MQTDHYSKEFNTPIPIFFQDMFADNFDGEKQARKDEEEARKKEEEKAEADAMNLVMELKSIRIFRISAK